MHSEACIFWEIQYPSSINISGVHNVKLLDIPMQSFAIPKLLVLLCLAILS